jgi:hypothetical protein
MNDAEVKLAKLKEMLVKLATEFAEARKILKGEAI